MGFISNMVEEGGKKELFPGRERSASTWREIFNISKEDRPKPVSRPVPGGSFGRGIFGGPAAEASTKRLLQSLRSMAPGGWSDDRYGQSAKYTDIRYVCVHRTNEMLLQSEFKVYRRDPAHPDGKRPITPHDPPEGDRLVRPWDLVKLLERPNPDDTFGDIMAATNLQMDLTGSALTWMVPNQLGTPYELYPIPTAIAVPQPCINPDYPDGFYRIQPLYPYGPFSSYPTPNSAVGAPIPAQWMLKVKYVHPLLRYDGYSPQTGLRLHLDEIEQMDRSRWYALKRLVNPSAVLNFEGMEGMQELPWEEIERIKADFEAEHQGPENTGKLYVSVNGKLEPWSNNLRDMEYKDGWDQLVGFVMAGLGISKEAAGMVGSSAYAVLFAALKQFHLLTLVPKCHRIAAKLTRHLAPFFGDDLIVEIHPARVDDHDIAFSKVEKMISGKLGTVNEARKLLDLPLTQEEWGKERLGAEPQQQPGMPESGMPASPAGANGAPVGASPNRLGGGQSERAEPRPPDIGGAEAARPKPGPLGAGSLGPRKALNGHHKTLNGRLAKVLGAVHAKELPYPVTQEGDKFTISPVINISTPQPVNNVTVNVPEQKAPQVTVDNRPEISVQPTPVTVRVPRLRPPVVKVQVPKQLAPRVNVSVPPQKTPVVNVTVPQGLAPEVTVNVPEQQPPTVTVEVPPPQIGGEDARIRPARPPDKDHGKGGE